MKTVSANFNSLCHFNTQLPLCWTWLMLVLIFWLGICVEVDAEIVTPPAPMFFCLPTILWDGTKLLWLAESASSNIVLYSHFTWLNRSMTLIRAETERYDIAGFSKTLGSQNLMNYVCESKHAGECWPWPRLCVPSWARDSTSRNLIKMSVTEESKVFICQTAEFFWVIQWYFS